MNSFKKENLKEHDIIILENESVFMLYQFDNDLHLISKLKVSSTISNYDNELKHKDNQNLDIIEIKRPERPQNLIYSNWEDAPVIWKRQEKPILSNNEYIILKNIDSDYQYIARDKNGLLYLYDIKPQKYNNHWNGDESTEFNMYSNFFKFIKWRDDEPYFIPNLLNEYKDNKTKGLVAIGQVKETKLPLLSEEEYNVLKKLDPKYRYIARDFYKQLCVYEMMPEKDGNVYVAYFKTEMYLKSYQHLFKFVEWGYDEKPYLIPDLLKDYENCKDNK